MSNRKFIFTILSITSFILAAYPQIGNVQAAPPADPHADAATASPDISVIIAPDNALGEPDDNLALIIGIGASLRLDMGDGEEGTGDLTVYYGGLEVSLLGGQASFLDENENLITTESFNLLEIGAGTHTVSISYDYAAHGYTAYRYVTFTGLLDIFGIDAIETASYLPDSDGDGLPDDWEINNGLDPLDDTDGTSDPDDDGLTNAEEYTEGTDPNDDDTDDDGMPDGWEIDNELNPLDDADASEDPDGDGFTNLEEYENGTDPHVPDFFFFLPIIFN